MNLFMQERGVMDGAPRIQPDSPARHAAARAPMLKVLASGSSGNCTVLCVPTDAGLSVCLIDLGISPRRTEACLNSIGLTLDDVGAIVLTHLDSDHFYSGWIGSIPRRACLWLHRSHLGEGERIGALFTPSAPFDRAFNPLPGVQARAVLAAHDHTGVSILEFTLSGVSGGSARLGWATDIGHVDKSVIELLRDVDVLAIESNYCPDMQINSDRPQHLKRRIMGGSGHLSNAECVHAVEAIGPRQHVVLLHLSEQCNTPRLVAAHHAGADYSVTIAPRHVPSRWVRVGGYMPSHSATVRAAYHPAGEPA